MESKTCTLCNVQKSFENFNKQPNSKNGLNARCKDCVKVVKQNYYKENKEKVKAKSSKWFQKNKEKHAIATKKWVEKNREKTKGYGKTYRLKKFGLDFIEYTKMLDEQEQSCYICRTHATSFVNSLAVDHCHSSGKVRKLLCHPCNAGLGLFRDSPELLIKAAEYLKEHNV